MSSLPKQPSSSGSGECILFALEEINVKIGFAVVFAVFITVDYWSAVVLMLPPSKLLRCCLGEYYYESISKCPLELNSLLESRVMCEKNKKSHQWLVDNLFGHNC